MADWQDWLRATPATAALRAFAARRDVGPTLRRFLFDPEWYAARHGVAAADALYHYQTAGAAAGLDPNGWFSESSYRDAYPDVRLGLRANHWRCGFHHYLVAGAREHRSPGPAFNELAYLGTHPDVLAEVRAGQAPCARLRIACLGDSPGLAPEGPGRPLSLPTIRRRRDQQPTTSFAEGTYLAVNGDVAKGGEPGAGQRHWLANGIDEDLSGERARAPGYVEALYLRNNADIQHLVDAGVIPSGYHHWLSYGVMENRPSSLSLWQAGERRHLARAFTTRSPVPDAAGLPAISVVVPVFNTHGPALQACIQSVLGQTYGGWELCLADDGSSEPATLEILSAAAYADARIKVGYANGRGGISSATNRAIAMSTAPFVAFLDHDDMLVPDSLLHLARAFTSAAEVDLVYTDEAKIDEHGNAFGLNPKPGWSPELLLGTMYIGHLAAYRRTLLDELGGLRPGLDGTQDYDLALRAAEKLRSVVHVPLPLYLWRLSSTSTAGSLDRKPGVLRLQRQALEATLLRRGQRGTVRPGHAPGHWSVLLDVPAELPLVSVVIPTAGRTALVGGIEVDLVANLLHSLLATERYPNVEYVVCHNGDLRAETLQAVGAVPHLRLLHYRAERFNLSEKINAGVAAAAGEYVLLLNDDMQAASGDVIRSMLGRMFPGVGVVGGRLLFADGTLQHAGVVWVGDGPTHAMIGEHRQTAGPAELLKLLHNCFAVSGACMMLRRDTFLCAGGFPEHLPLNYNDIALCLGVRQAGLRVVFDPNATFFHFEAQSKLGTYFWELQRLVLSQPGLSDPYFSPTFSRRSPFYELTNPDEPEQPSYVAWLLARIDARRALRPRDERTKFTILLSVYQNRRDQLEELEATVLNQTYPNWDWIVVDDGSTKPGTLAWLDAVRRHDRVTVIRLPQNRGIMAGYGAAFRAATGDYVVPVDADDFLTLDCLQVLAAAIEAEDRPEGLYSDEDKATERGTINSPFLKPDWDPVLFTNTCYVCHVCAVRRDAALAAGCYTDDLAAWCHDWDTFWRLARAGCRIVHVPEVLYSWRIHPGSTASLATGTKPQTALSQKHVLDRHLRLTGLDRAFEIVRNTLFPHDGLWRLRPRPAALPPVALLLMAGSGLDPDSSLLTDLARGLRDEDVVVVVGGGPGFRVALDGMLPELTAHIRRGRFAGTLDQALGLVDATGIEISAVLDTGLTDLGPDWLREGAGLFAAAPGVVAVGGQLLQPDGRVAWQGGFLGFGALAGAPDHGRDASGSGYYGLAWCQRCVDAVPAPLFFARTDALRQAAAAAQSGTISPRALAAELALLARRTGQRIVYTPFVRARLLHPASVEPLTTGGPPPDLRSHYYHRDFGRSLATAYMLDGNGA